MDRNREAFRNRFLAYKNGKSVNEIYDAGYIKEPVITPDALYNEYINSLPDNQRLTPESLYRSHRYWELNDKPKNFGEAIGRGMFTYDFTDNGWHAKSVALNKKTGEYEFMKPNWHSTKMYEDAWYYSKDGELFRNRYTKKAGAAYDKYIPKYKNGNLPGYTLGKNPTNATMYDDGTFIDDYTKVFDNLVATGTDKRPLYLRYDAPNSTYDPNAIRNFTDLAPVVGDIGQGLDAYNAFKNKDYTLAGILGTMLLLPNIIEKPIKHISKPMFRFINRFADIGDDAIDASILTGGMLGGIGAGFAIGDTGEEKLKYGYLGGVLGSIPGFGRYVLRDLQRSNKYIPYNIRKIIDPILDPVEYTKAHIGGYYGKYPTLELLRDEIQRLYKLWGIDADPNDLLTKTNILTEPEYILKHGSSSTGVQLRGLGGGIDLLGNKRNSLLPPKNTMQGSSTKNPLLGTYAHEVNHAIHDTFITKPYTLSTPGRFHDPLSGLMSEYYYIPNELYIHPNVTSNFKQIIGENWKKWKWLGSPEEFESELQNYLSMHNINYSLITKHQKSDLLRKISKRFDIKPSNETTLSNLLDYLGNDSDIYPNTRITYAYKDGKIAIKPSKRGTFTAAAKKHGASVREFESRVLKNPEKYSTAMVKKARFSRNARSWKH